MSAFPKLAIALLAGLGLAGCARETTPPPVASPYAAVARGRVLPFTAPSSARVTRKV